jgi:hypothetical protein
LRLHAKSLHLGLLLLAMLVAGACSGLGQAVVLQVGYSVDFQVPASLLLPLAGSSVMAGLIIDPFGTDVAISTRPLPLLVFGRLGISVVAFAGGVIAAASAVGGVESISASVETVRNLGVLAGLTLLAIVILDSTQAWIPTAAYTIACMLAGVDDEGRRRPWAGLLEEDPRSPAPWVVAGTLLAVGAGAALIRIRTLQGR